MRLLDFLSSLSHVPLDQFILWLSLHQLRDLSSDGSGTYQKLTSVALQGAIHVRRTLCFWTSVAWVAQSCIVHNKALIFFGFSRKLTKLLYLHLHYDKLLPSSPQLTQVERKCPQVYDHELSSNKQRLRILWMFSPFPTTLVELFQHDKMTQTIFNSIHVSLKSLWIHYKPTLQ